MGLVGVHLEVGRLADQHVRALGELEGALAQARVHDEGDHLARAPDPDLLEGHGVAVDLDLALELELLDHRAAQARLAQLLGLQGPAGVLFEAVAESGHAVAERGGAQAQALAALVLAPDHPRSLDGVAVDLGPIMVDRGPAQAVVVLLARGRVVDVDRVGAAVEGQELGDPSQAQTVVAMEVGNADLGDVGGRHPRVDQLTLGPLTGIEEETLAVPAQEIAVVVAVAGGHLAGGAQNNELT